MRLPRFARNGMVVFCHLDPFGCAQGRLRGEIPLVAGAGEGFYSCG